MESLVIEVRADKEDGVQLLPAEMSGGCLNVLDPLLGISYEAILCQGYQAQKEIANIFPDKPTIDFFTSTAELSRKHEASTSATVPEHPIITKSLILEGALKPTNEDDYQFALLHAELLKAVSNTSEKKKERSQRKEHQVKSLYETFQSQESNELKSAAPPNSLLAHEEEFALLEDDIMDGLRQTVSLPDSLRELPSSLLQDDESVLSFALASTKLQLSHSQDDLQETGKWLQYSSGLVLETAGMQEEALDTFHQIQHDEIKTENKGMQHDAFSDMPDHRLLHLLLNKDERIPPATLISFAGLRRNRCIDDKYLCEQIQKSVGAELFQRHFLSESEPCFYHILDCHDANDIEANTTLAQIKLHQFCFDKADFFLKRLHGIKF